VYGKVKELPPPLLRKPKITTPYDDVSMMHDLLSNRSETEQLHLVNQTPIACPRKEQTTVEPDPHGPAYPADRTCVERNIDLQKLHYCGTTLMGTSDMLGEDKSAMNSSTIPSKLDERHVISLFHRVHSAAGIIEFQHIQGKENPTGMLKNHWASCDVWPALQPVLYTNGNTAKHLQKGEVSTTWETPLSYQHCWTTARPNGECQVFNNSRLYVEIMDIGCGFSRPPMLDWSDLRNYPMTKEGSIRNAELETVGSKAEHHQFIRWVPVGNPRVPQVPNRFKGNEHGTYSSCTSQSYVCSLLPSCERKKDKI